MSSLVIGELRLVIGCAVVNPNQNEKLGVIKVLQT